MITASCDPGVWGPDGGGTQILVALFAFGLPMLALLAVVAYGIKKGCE